MEIDDDDRRRLVALAAQSSHEWAAPPEPPPHVVLVDVVPREVHDAVWAALVADEAAFSSNDAPGRRALVRESPGPELDTLAAVLDEALGARLAELVGRLSPGDSPTGLRLPRGADMVVSAHGHGDLLAPHTDHGPVGSTHLLDRVLTVTCYLSKRPATFTGGQLRLHGHRTVAGRRWSDQSFVDVEPTAGHVVVHPSWLTHEVVTVRRPDADFADRRFAVTGFVTRPPG